MSRVLLSVGAAELVEAPAFRLQFLDEAPIVAPAFPEPEEAFDRRTYGDDEADGEREPGDDDLRLADSVDADERRYDHGADDRDQTESVVAAACPLRRGFHPQQVLEPARAEKVALFIAQLKRINQVTEVASEPSSVER